MNLEDLDYFKAVDSQNCLGRLEALPDEILAAWRQAQTRSLPEMYRSVSNVVIAGMGAGLLGGALAQTLAVPESRAPILVQPGYTLPAFARTQTLVIMLSASADSEAALSMCEAALAHEARLLIITEEMNLALLAEQRHVPIWHLAGREGAEAGVFLAVTLAVLAKLGFIADKAGEMTEATAAMRAQQTRLRAETPVRDNPAKRLAGQLMNRLPMVIAAGFLTPVAYSWQRQINLLARASCQAETLAGGHDHISAGTQCPEALTSKIMALFLSSTYDQPSDRQRAEATRQACLAAGYNVDTVQAAGPSPLAHLLTALDYGSYVAYYLAMCYGVNPAHG
jgi:glucose/mannose-6-phosphate isomerase